ncbi:MAG: dihydrolipoyl dehydrogenase [Dehalococcoidia bacterium]|nr:dihydrolipoyl dehydrogenase [Dehalococcoidia bacterium]
MTTPRIRLAVIGAGPGGYPAAFLAADLGMEVTLIDPEAKPGGVCLYRGCIPSKSLLHAAHVLHQAEEAAAFGINFAKPEVDLDGLRGWKDKVVARLTDGLSLLSKQRNVRYVRGRARFVHAHTLHVRLDGELVEVEFDYAIVATGSRPARPGPLSLDSSRVWDSTRALEVPEVPGTLLVVGGGYIGLELGSVYAALGSQVTIVEMTQGLLPGVDRDLVVPLQKRLKAQGVEVLLGTHVTQLEESGAVMKVELSGAQVDGAREVDRVLVAVGRSPNSSDLGLEGTGVRLDARGFIEVDTQRRTGEASIFAIGDVAGEPMLAHKATHEARVAVEAIAGQPSMWAPLAIPAVVFTDPEIAWCGLTEETARAAGTTIEVSRFPWAASGRATTLGRNDGVTKLIIEPGTERVLGVGITGAGAGELIAEGVLAIEMGARATDLHLAIHAHPTLSETVMESAALFFGQSQHYSRPTRT